MLLSLSLNAKQASLEVREQLAFLPEELPDLGAFLRPHVAEALILSTCQRFEAYVIPRAAMAPECLAGLFAAYRHADLGRVSAAVQGATDRAAAEHLFRVAAGLESPVVGEAQILGQVRRALEMARTANLIEHRLGSLVQHAVVAGRRVRDETALGRGALSVPRMGVDQARREIGELANRTVVLVGAGETARLAAKALDGVGKLLVVNRTLARAQALADEHRGEALPWAALPAAVAGADLVVCGAGGHQPAITQELVAAAQQQRGGRLLVLVDLSVPRAVEPSAVAVPGVRLITVADLQERSNASQAERLREVPKAEAIVAQELNRAWRTWEGAEAHQAIAALRQQAEEVRRQELERAQRHLASLPPELGETVELMTRAIVNKLLHQPTLWLKTHPALADGTLRDLFGIELSAAGFQPAAFSFQPVAINHQFPAAGGQLPAVNSSFQPSMTSFQPSAVGDQPKVHHD